MSIFRRRKVGQYNSKSFEEEKKKSEDCVKRIKRMHHSIIVESGEEREKGLEDTIFSDAALQSICDDADRFGDVFEYAAVALERIAVMHPFVEGNKRTALATTLSILNKDGYTLGNNANTLEFIKCVAAGKYGIDEIERWLRMNAIRIS